MARLVQRRSTVVVAVAVGALILGSVSGVVPSAAAKPVRPGPKPHVVRPVRVARASGKRARFQLSSRSALKPPALKSPAVVAKPVMLHPATYRVVLPAGRWAAVGDTGIAVRAGSGVQSRLKAVRVEVLAAAAARRFGVAGIALRVTRADGGTLARPLNVRMPSSLISGMYGADYAHRVRWVQRAACVGHQCARSIPLRSQPASPRPPTGASARSSSTGATVFTAQVSSASTMVNTASTTSSVDGTFAATPLKSADSWQVSPQSGAFTWSYGVRTIPAAAGPQPDVSVNYDSTLIDGENEGTNNQAPFGDGWNLGGTGYIERSYAQCTGVSGYTSSQDLCWQSNNATLSFGGHSGPLVWNSTTSTYHLSTDDGTTVQYLTGSSNGTHDGGYWLLTEPDGTKYYYGLNNIPGDSTATNSAWWVPVSGIKSTSYPCYNATFTSSFCNQAWRWNLDYVVDPHGNAEAFYYSAEQNYYLEAGKAIKPYIRGGQPTYIDYGSRAGGENFGSAPERVIFNIDTRCMGTSTDCSTQPPDSANAWRWPDTPWDLYCTSTSCTQTGPSFWTTKRLDGIFTQRLNSGGSYTYVDVYIFTQNYVQDVRTVNGLNYAFGPYQLVLNQIDHQGWLQAGQSYLAPPSTVITGTFMPNLITTGGFYDEVSLQRVTGITTDTGAQVTVNYLPAQCTQTTLPSPSSNTKRCYPVKNSSTTDWYNIFPVSSVIQNANMAAPGMTAPNDQTTYDYSVGTPAWRYDTSPFIPSTLKTWSMFAGFSKVRVEHGDPNAPSSLESKTYTYFQGMDGDNNGSGGTRSVTLTAGDGTTVTDSLWFAGRVLEEDDYNGSTLATRIITLPWASAATANDGTYQSHFVDDGEVRTRITLTGGTYRNTDVSNTFDSLGRLVAVDDQGDTSISSDDKCTTTTYATGPTGANMLSYVATVLVTNTRCATTPTYPANGVSYTVNYYDNQSSPGTITGPADLTQVQDAKQFNAGTTLSTVNIPTETYTYDGLGRQLSTTNALNETTQYAYTPAFSASTPLVGVGPLTQMVTTNPKGWTSTRAFDPSGLTEIYAIDVNGNRTDADYDPLGRVIRVWEPDRPKANNANSPSVSYVYSSTAPFSVATTTLTPTTTQTSYALYDGLTRLRQVQVPAEGSNQQATPGSSGSDVTDYIYDAASRQIIKNNPYLIANAPSSTLWLPANGESDVPSETATSYDGLGRDVADQTIGKGTLAWQTTYAYGGDHTDVTPPTGGTPTTTYYDARGNTTSLLQYHGTTPSGAADTTTYTYNTAGDMLSMTDSAGNVRSWTYDLFGDKTSETDPNTGTTSYAYNDIQLETQSTDARGAKLQTTYDQLDRRTAVSEYQSAASGWALDSSWTYDTLAKGQLTSSTTYVGSTPGANGTPYTTAVTGYDAVYRPLGNSYTLPTSTGALAGTYTTTYTYNQDGSLATQADPAEGGLPAETITSSYTAIGHVAQTGISGTNFYDKYNGLNQVSQDVRNSSSQSLYDTFGYEATTARLSYQVVTNATAASPTVASRVYTYDNAGDIKAVADTPSSGPADTQCFSYDYLQRLTQADTPANNSCSTAPTNSNLGGPAPYWQTYTYDLAGNRTSIIRHATSTTASDARDTYGYVTASNKLQTVTHATAPAGGTTYTNTGTDNYTQDASGNTTGAPGLTMGYDAQGNMSAVTAGSVTQDDVYDAAGNLLVRSDSTNGTTAYLGDTELTLNQGGALTANRTYDGAGTTFACRTTTVGNSTPTLTWLSTDPQGTATVDENPTSGVTTVRHFDPFGNSRDAAAVTWPNTDSYLNKPANLLIDAVRLGARDVVPTIGRFLSPDPIVDPMDPQQTNGYSYADNNPSTRSDPSGLRSPCEEQGTCGSESNSSGGRTPVRKGGAHDTSGEAGNGMPNNNSPTGEPSSGWGSPPPAPHHSPHHHGSGHHGSGHHVHRPAQPRHSACDASCRAVELHNYTGGPSTDGGFGYCDIQAGYGQCLAQSSQDQALQQEIANTPVPATTVHAWLHPLEVAGGGLSAGGLLAAGACTFSVIGALCAVPSMAIANGGSELASGADILDMALGGKKWNWTEFGLDGVGMVSPLAGVETIGHWVFDLGLAGYSLAGG